MWLKFALIVAVVCVAQGVAYRRQGYYRGMHRKDAGEEETENLLDEVGGLVSASAGDANLKGVNPDDIVFCFKKGKDEAIVLEKHVVNMIMSSLVNMREKYGDTISTQLEAATIYANVIINIIRTVPVKIWEYINNKEFSKVVLAFEEAKKTATENVAKLKEVVGELKKELPEAAEDFESALLSINKEVYIGARKLGREFIKCLKHKAT